jgi:hypothetical protein
MVDISTTRLRGRRLDSELKSAERKASLLQEVEKLYQVILAPVLKNGMLASWRSRANART